MRVAESDMRFRLEDGETFRVWDTRALVTVDSQSLYTTLVQQV